MDQLNIARIGFTINLLVDEIGAVLFITLIYVIIKYRNLRKTHCLKLIGIFMFCNLFSKIIIWGPYLIRVIPLVNMPMIVCCGWYLITLTPCNGQLPFSTLIAFDRAVSVFFPTWYSNPNKKFYLLMLCTLGSIYPIYNCVFLVLIAADRPFRPTNCTGGEVFGNYQPFDYQCIYAAIFFYVVMIVKLLINGKERKSYFNKQPLFKSIAVIMAVQICGWFMVKNAYQYIPKIFFNNATENELPLLYYAINCFPSLTVTAEFFAIYISSIEDTKHSDAGVRITVATRSHANGDRLVQIAPKCVELVVVDVQNEPNRILQLIEKTDLCISLLPYIHHVAIAKMCIQKGTNMLTSSYISPGLQELDEAAKAAGITVMNEAGLDPGIDHMLAMQCIDQIHAKGGKVKSFVSFCGGLPSPEASDNPLRYKFSWSPKGMLLALLNPAKYLKDGRLVEVEGNCGVLDAQYPIRFMPGFNFVAYPNRDSTKYLDIYGIEGECRTILRGTLRFQGFVEAIKVLKAIGFLTPLNEGQQKQLQDILYQSNGTSFLQLCAFLMGQPQEVSADQLKITLTERLNFVGKEQGIEAVERLGLFSDKKMSQTNVVNSDTLLDMLAQHLAATLKFADGERDLVVLVHDLEAELPNGQIECHQISLTAYGEQDKMGGYSAMARTVGYTCAITAHMMLKGEITQKGILRPVSREIYEPILEGLKHFGIRARATRTMVPKGRGKL